MSESAQVKRTKDHIKRHFLELMAKSGIEKLTVVTLVEEADINRGTFYKYYRDKYDVLEEIEEALFLGYWTIMEEKVPINLNKMLQTASQSVLQSFLAEQFATVTHYFSEHRGLLKILLSENGDPHFVKKVEGSYVNFIKAKLSIMEIADRHTYESIFFLRGVIAVIEEWILVDGQETPDDIAQLLARGFFTSPMEMMGLPHS